MKNKKTLVITTINKPTVLLKRISSLCKKNNINLILIGDKKSPKKFKLKHSNFYNISQQEKLSFEFTKHCPKNSYSRKNIGYLIAIKEGSQIVIDSDDDNIPKKTFFKKFNQNQICLKITNKKWINIYQYFLKNKKNIWPRGFPLDEILIKKKIKGRKILCNIPVQQFLTELDPDVDAIYRLVFKSQNLEFNKKLPLAIAKNSYTPFNSQNTRWFKISFPLLYLPSYCPFRCSDILRGYIAMRILHHNNLCLGYFPPSNFQIRNKHNLAQDFEEETLLYNDSKKIIDLIYNIKLPSGQKNITQSLYKIYKVLIKQKYFPKKELLLLNSWIKDLNNII